MTVVRRVAVFGFSVLLFWLAWSLFASRQGHWRQAPGWGQAPAAVRSAVLDRLRVFQDGYTRRDVAAADAFVRDLFSADQPLVLGTMPREIFAGTDRVRDVISSDWKSWGDCRFRVADTAVSAAGGVAWFATVGSVQFDLSRYLVLPLRLTGIMAKEADGIWRIRQLQFQFDLDLSLLLLLNLVLLAWALVNAVWVGVAVFRYTLGRR